MRMARRHLLTTSGLGFAGLAAGLGPARPGLAADLLPVGVLIPGSRSDRGWMESGYDGMRRAEAKYADKVKISFIENISFGEYEQVLVTLASKNPYVIGIGGQTQATVQKVAKRFPRTKFVIIGGNRDPEMQPNMAVYDVRQAEIAYVAGAAAALLSRTGGVSYVGGLEIPAIVNAGKEYGNGAKAVRADVKVFESYTGDFDDVAKTKEATLAAIAQGADIHYHILNLGHRGMEQAAREKGTHMIGSYTDRCGADPLYIAYSITGVGFQVEYAIDQMVAGSFTSEFKPFGLGMGPQSSGFVICEGATPEITAKLDAIKADILSGKIKTLES